MSTLDLELEPKASVVRRIEVFTGAGRRRTSSAEEKARIVAESVEGGTSVCSVARRHGLSPQQLFGWRREARATAAPEKVANGAELFVPAVVDRRSTSGEAPARSSSRSRRRNGRAGSVGTTASIELEIGGLTVRVGRDAAAETIAAVIRALKAGA